MKSIEEQLHEANDEIKKLKVENSSLKEAVSAGKVAAAKAERSSMLKESKLPEPCVARIDEAFSKSTDNAGLKEAINVEAAYVKTLMKIDKNNGPNDNGSRMAEADEETTKIADFKERQYTCAIASGMSEAEATAMSGFKPKK